MRIGVFQACTGIDPAANAADLVNAIDRAGRDGADIVFTPEMSGLLDRDRTRAAPHLTIEADDPTLHAVCQAAARNRMWVQLGSLAVRRDDGMLANRAFLIDDVGAVRARYDKMHLFDVDLPNGESWRESAAYVAGDQAVVADMPDMRIGLSICYDLRFPALYQALSGAGATLIAIPAAFTAPTGRDHWHILLRARAIETGAFVVAAAQAGRHEDGRETYGHSLVIDPWGAVLLDLGDRTGLGVVDIDPAQVDAVRQRIPVVAHRRPVAQPIVAA